MDLRHAIWLGCAFIACTPATEPPPDPRVEVLLERVEALEARLKALERRGNGSRSRPADGADGPVRSKAKAKAKARPAPTQEASAPREGLVLIEMEGDASRVVLSSDDRKWRLPRRVPPGEYWLLTDFGDGSLKRHKQVVIDREPQVVHCSSEAQACEFKAKTP